MSEIILKHGPGVPKKVGSTVLSPGEPGWSTDLHQLFVGTADPQAPIRIAGGSDSYVNVKDFGASGDGITDDTAAFKAACGAAGTGGLRKAVYIPAGNYKVGNIITEPIIQLTMFGDHRDVSQIHVDPTADAFHGTSYSRIAMASMRANCAATATKPFIYSGNGPLTWITMTDCTMNSDKLSHPMIQCVGSTSAASGLVMCTRSVFTGGICACLTKGSSVRLFMLQCSCNNYGWNNFARLTATDCSLAGAGGGTYFAGSDSVLLEGIFFLNTTATYLVDASGSVGIHNCHARAFSNALVGDATNSDNARISISNITWGSVTATAKLVDCPTAPEVLDITTQAPSTMIDSPTAKTKDYRSCADGIWFNGAKVTP